MEQPAAYTLWDQHLSMSKEMQLPGGHESVNLKRRRRRRGRRRRVKPMDRYTGSKSTTESDGSRKSNAVALDCEMVGVGPLGKRSVLARVSIVDWFGNIILDSFVKVEEPVTDYRTHVSGVRKEDLQGPNAMDYGSCRAKVQRILKNKILVGHALMNDMKVLHLKHPWHMRRDSAMFQPFLRPNLKPRRLKDLVFTELGCVIQQEGQEHNSVEDAWAAMRLYQLHQVAWDNDINNCMLQCHVGSMAVVTM